MNPDRISDLHRYHLWYIPDFPIDVPLVRPREELHEWRVNLLESETIDNFSDCAR